MPCSHLLHVILVLIKSSQRQCFMHQYLFNTCQQLTKSHSKNTKINHTKTNVGKHGSRRTLLYLFVESNVSWNKFFWRCLLCLSVSQRRIITCQLIQLLLRKLVVRKLYTTGSYCCTPLYGVAVCIVKCVAFVKIRYLTACNNNNM